MKLMQHEAAEIIQENNNNGSHNALFELDQEKKQHISNGDIAEDKFDSVNLKLQFYSNSETVSCNMIITFLFNSKCLKKYLRVAAESFEIAINTGQSLKSHLTIAKSQILRKLVVV
jgi:hypothetical protein